MRRRHGFDVAAVDVMAVKKAPAVRDEGRPCPDHGPLAPIGRPAVGTLDMPAVRMSRDH
jgi:hypothetical protein